MWCVSYIAVEETKQDNGLASQYRWDPLYSGEQAIHIEVAIGCGKFINMPHIKGYGR